MAIETLSHDVSGVETLSIAALDAAIELDRLIRNQSYVLDPVNHFADELAKTITSVNNNEEGTILADVGQLLALTSAIGAFSGTPVSTVEEFRTRVTDLIEKFRAASQEGEELPKSLRAFCLGLHREFLALRGDGREDQDIDNQ